MKLHNPFIITSRLLPGLKIGETTISFEILDETTNDNRDICRYYIDNGDYEFSASDLKSGCGGFESIQKAAESFLDFLSAALESYHYNGNVIDQDDNSSLFSREVLELFSGQSDEISCLRCDIEENPGLIEE